MVYLPVIGMLEDGQSNSIDSSGNIHYEGVKMGMTKETDGIESDNRERSRKELESEKKESERGRVMARKTNGEKTT